MVRKLKSDLKKEFLENLSNAVKSNIIQKKYYKIILDFFHSYEEEMIKSNISEDIYIPLFNTFLDLIEKQILHPYVFPIYHKKITHPFNYYNFGLDFFRNMIDFKNSSIIGEENLNKMEKQIKNNENVILLSNHQSELDPQAISLMLEKKHSLLADKIINVAGERVIKDMLAIPFSMGCNLLCIYSKKYINVQPETKRDKQLHNKKTMEYMSSLLSEGGIAIYIAPSGGRDRPNKNKEVELAEFDPKSLEYIYLMAKKAITPTHFYTLSLDTYALLPPPDSLQIEMGEIRKTKRSSVHLYFGDEINMDNFPGNNVQDKAQKRQNRADYIFEIVKNNYKKITGK